MQIAHDQVVGVLRELLEGGPAAGDAGDIVALPSQSQLDQLPHIGVVVHHQDPRHEGSGIVLHRPCLSDSSVDCSVPPEFHPGLCLPF